MDIIIRRKILKSIVIIAFAFTFIFLVGCSASNNTLKTISTNMDKVINEINKIEAIDTSTLIIDDIIDENNLEFYAIEEPALYQLSTNKIDNYVLKIKLLNNSIYNTIALNNQLNSAKKQIISKAHQVKSLSEQCIEENCKIDDSILDTLAELNNSVMAYTSRSYLSRNEVKNHINNINQIKTQYSSKADQLSSRYEKLQASLNTRLSYYVNIYEGLSSMAYAVSANSVNNNCYYEQNCKDCETSKSEQVVETGSKKENFFGLKKNIDTYENAGKDIYGFNKRYPNYNQDNYLNGYGYNPNFYNNGYGLYGGYGNIYNSGFGMPYGFGYGMTYPNINTFGTYKNIDTYRMYPNKHKENEIVEDDNEIVESSADIINKEAKEHVSKPLYDNNYGLQNPPPPIPKPYIPPFELEKPMEENEKVDKPKTLENLEEYNMSNDEDTFVATKPAKPKIEKLEK